ncbi:MAG: acylphosphatase [Candidatus Paceibacterota bacterium]
MEEIRCIVSGKVQMVMFRDFVQRKARKLGLTGFVKNNPDGSVEVVAQGAREKLTQLLEHLQKGPFLAHVVRVLHTYKEPDSDFRSFTIEH